jgi:hypothetical protein
LVQATEITVVHIADPVAVMLVALAVVPEEVADIHKVVAVITMVVLVVADILG